MSFTRRHYEEVARIIRTNRDRSIVIKDRLDAEYHRGIDTAVGNMQMALRQMFAADNPRFDAVRFDMACEPRSEK